MSKVSDLWKKEDWLAVWIGAVVILVACIAVLTGWFDFSALKFSTWTVGEDAPKAVALGTQLGAWAFWRKLLVTVASCSPSASSCRAVRSRNTSPPSSSSSCCPSSCASSARNSP